MYRRILTTLVIFILSAILYAQDGFCVIQWNKAIPQSTDLKSAWPATSQANLSILDSLISNYQRGFYLSYTSSSTITVSSGEIVVSNSTGSIRLFLVNTTSGSITFSNLDTGASAASTQYYVYAGTSTATDSAPTFYVSLSATAPTGVTYYELIGSFVTDSSTQITNIINTNLAKGYSLGTLSTKSFSVTYQALTDGEVKASASACGNNQSLCLYTDSSSSPSTTPIPCLSNSSGITVPYNMTERIRAGDYWKVTSSCSQPGDSNTVNFQQIGV